jgi:hypothetical protein
VMLDIVTFKWASPTEYRSTFNFKHVNILFAMCCRHYPHPFRFHCVTDNPDHINPDIIVHKLWDEHADIPSPVGHGNPSCYRRLKMFSTEAREMFGSRILTLDLDVVITADMSPVWNRPDDFVIWGDTSPRTPYNGSMILMDAGCRRHVWNTFDPIRSPALSLASGAWGSDQAWISCVLGRGEKMWGCADGVYSFRNHILPNQGVLPNNARIVIFHGNHDPWSPIPQQLPWVRDNWL